MAGCRGGLLKSNITMRGKNTMLAPDVAAASNSCGNLAVNISSENDSSPRSTPDSVLWRFWEAGYERSFHGAPAIADLGEI
jgi:hypothetical protein